MTRMNKSKGITGRPQSPKADTHGQAVAQAYADGLAEYATKHPVTGEPMLHTAADRRRARQAQAKAQAQA